MKLFRVKNGKKEARQGYSANYVADIVLNKSVQDVGFIIVEIDKGTTTSPHAHAHLEEVFVALKPVTINVDEEKHNIETGDTVIISPGEFHSFSAPKDTSGLLLAIKLPNISDDKVINSD